MFQLFGNTNRTAHDGQRHTIETHTNRIHLFHTLVSYRLLIQIRIIRVFTDIICRVAINI